MRLESGEGGKVEHLMVVASVLGIAEDLIKAIDLTTAIWVEHAPISNRTCPEERRAARRNTRRG